MALQMPELAFKVLNGPVCIFNLVAYIFYAFCLFCRQDGADVPKQPLKVLLGTLVMFMAILQISILFFVFVEGHINMIWAIVRCIQLFLLEYSLISVVWLNVFYYTQIVPSHSAFSIWLKRNIKCIVYSAMISAKLLCIFDVTMPAIQMFTLLMNSTSSNSTSSLNSLIPTTGAVTIFRVISFLLSLMLMMASSCATVSYLRRHLRNMKLNQSPVTSSLRSQKRVVIAGIVQIVLLLVCVTWFLLEILFVAFYQGFDDHGYIWYTSISLYTFSTALNLGSSQSLLRRGIIGLGQRVSTFFNS